MAVVFPSNTAVQVGTNAFRVGWTSDNPNCRVYINGQYVGHTTAGSWILTWDQLASRGQIEILDDELTWERTQRSQWLIQWNAVAGVEAYRVERYNGSTWDTVTEIQGSGLTRHRYLTPALANVLTAHQIRVGSIGEDGNEATPVVATITSVRHPDPPPVTGMTYVDGTNKVVIAA